MTVDGVLDRTAEPGPGTTCQIRLITCKVVHAARDRLTRHHRGPAFATAAVARPRSPDALGARGHGPNAAWSSSSRPPGGVVACFYVCPGSMPTRAAGRWPTDCYAISEATASRLFQRALKAHTSARWPLGPCPNWASTSPARRARRSIATWTNGFDKVITVRDEACPICLVPGSGCTGASLVRAGGRALRRSSSPPIASGGRPRPGAALVRGGQRHTA
jgi:hypothetical protein